VSQGPESPTLLGHKLVERHVQGRRSFFSLFSSNFLIFSLSSSSPSSPQNFTVNQIWDPPPPPPPSPHFPGRASRHIMFITWQNNSKLGKNKFVCQKNINHYFLVQSGTCAQKFLHYSQNFREKRWCMLLEVRIIIRL